MTKSPANLSYAGASSGENADLVWFGANNEVAILITNGAIPGKVIDVIRDHAREINADVTMINLNPAETDSLIERLAEAADNVRGKRDNDAELITMPM
jgi:hypothetical protein